MYKRQTVSFTTTRHLRLQDNLWRSVLVASHQAQSDEPKGVVILEGAMVTQMRKKVLAAGQSK